MIPLVIAIVALLATGCGGHGAFYRPHPEWLEPVVRWARGEDPRPVSSARP